MKKSIITSLSTAAFIYVGLRYNGGMDLARYIGSSIMPIIMALLVSNMDLLTRKNSTQS